MKCVLQAVPVIVLMTCVLWGCGGPAVSAEADRPVAAAAPKRMRVYIGTYTNKGSKGIYVTELDLATGALTPPRLAATTDNPTFLAIDAGGKFLYAAGGAMKVEDKRMGAVTAFAIDPVTGALTQLNRQSSGGSGPCHVVLDAAGRCALAANYGSGSVASLPIGDDGKLGAPASTIQHVGSSVNKRRQSGPHAHSINLDSANRFAFAADLGVDKIFIYRYDAKTATLAPNTPPAVKLAPGAGPRHFAFAPDGRFAYVINELNSTLTAFAYDAQAGTLKEVHTVTTLPVSFEGNNSTAEIQIHPSGRFLYGSNRGHDSLAIFAIDPKTGRLTPLGHESVRGKTPRNFTIDPTGQYILAANQSTNNIVVFRIDQTTGLLKPTGHQIIVSIPVCVKFTPIPK